VNYEEEADRRDGSSDHDFSGCSGEPEQDEDERARYGGQECDENDRSRFHVCVRPTDLGFSGAAGSAVPKPQLMLAPTNEARKRRGGAGPRPLLTGVRQRLFGTWLLPRLDRREHEGRIRQTQAEAEADQDRTCTRSERPRRDELRYGSLRWTEIANPREKIVLRASRRGDQFRWCFFDGPTLNGRP